MLFLRDRRKGEAGYGVMELVVVLSVAVVVTTMATLGFSGARARYELKQKAQNLTYQIERARSIAIKHNKTLTLDFSSDKRTFGLTCDDCQAAKDELPSVTLPSDLKLSAFPTVTIRGNGTVQASTGSLTLSDGQGRELGLTINNSGRLVVGAVSPARETSSTSTSTSTSTQQQ